MSFLDQDQHYSVTDYLKWPDDTRCELIHGAIHDMSPAPSIQHQTISGNLFGELRSFVLSDQGREEKGLSSCQVFHAPIDVVLSPDTVVQPDIVIVCDHEKLQNGKHILGPPDAAVEILSKSTALKDRREKKTLYQQFGVYEYLIIDPFEEYAEYYRMDAEGRYEWPVMLGPEDDVAFQCLPGFAILIGAILASS